MTLPTCESKSNFTTIDIGQFCFYFSYRTLIAFYVVGNGYTVRSNRWGPTTGKHLNSVDGGSNEAKARRLETEVFEAAYEKLVGSILK